MWPDARDYDGTHSNDVRGGGDASESSRLVCLDGDLLQHCRRAVPDHARAGPHQRAHLVLRQEPGQDEAVATEA